MTKRSNRKAKVTAYAAEHGLTYQQALRKLQEADPAVPPKQPVKARLIAAGCSWWVEITDARYWEKDNDGRYGYRPFPLWPDTVTPTPTLLDQALAGHGWERHVEEWPAKLGTDTAVFLRRTRHGFEEDREREAKAHADGTWECPAGLCGEYEDETECGNCWGTRTAGTVTGRAWWSGRLSTAATAAAAPTASAAKPAPPHAWANADARSACTWKTVASSPSSPRPRVRRSPRRYPPRPRADRPSPRSPAARATGSSPGSRSPARSW